eukprot:719891_1
MASKTCQIDSYLKDRDKDLYRDALFHFLNQLNQHDKPAPNNWYLVLNDISAEERYIFVQRLFNWFDDDEELSDFVLFKQWNGLSLFQALCKKGDVEALKYVLFDKRIQSDSDKCKSLAQLFVFEIPSNFRGTLDALTNGAHDMQILDTISKIVDLYEQKVAFQHKSFNYFTFKTTIRDDTEFKIVEEANDNVLSGGLVYTFGYE